MRIDATAVQLRPRPMFEAADLGVRLVQASARPLLACALPMFGLVILLSFALYPVASLLPTLVIWWAKPWLDRTVLFVLARQMFREPTRWSDLWAARRSVWWQGLWCSLTVRRLSPWRSFTQPTAQLEGLRGGALRRRIRQLRAGHEGAALGMTTAFIHVELAVAIGLPMLLVWLTPADELLTLKSLFAEQSPYSGFVGTLAYGIAVVLIEPFYVGAGFAMYLNRRVELEAWDVEQALRHAFAKA